MKIAVALTARPSYAKLRPVLDALVDSGADVVLLACASALLERYGRVVSVVRHDFPKLEIVECWSTYEGANLLTSAKETGALLSEAATALRCVGADRVLVIADRHEVLAVAQAAHYQHIELWHMQGGETSGSVDNRVRDAITALADYHFPSTDFAAFRVYGLTGAADRIFNYGCPSIDIAKRAQDGPPVTAEELGGDGAHVDFRKPVSVVIQHPVTSEASEAHAQMAMTLNALPHDAWLKTNAIVLWPGEDAGADAASKAMREHRSTFIHTVRNLPPHRFLKLLTQASVLIGNSSAGIREASYLGVPVVNIGTRQQGRERGPNVIDVPHEANAIARAIQQQIAHGRYPRCELYGRGDAGMRIAEVLACL